MGKLGTPNVTQPHTLVCVQPRDEHRWEVVMDGRDKSVRFTNRDTALSYAQIWAAVNRPSTVLLYGASHCLQGEWTFNAAGARHR